MVMISVLVEHPTEGLILFEVGPGKDYPDVWGPQMCDIFARFDYASDQELDAQIAKTGHNIKDVKAVIMGHLHLIMLAALTSSRALMYRSTFMRKNSKMLFTAWRPKAT